MSSDTGSKQEVYRKYIKLGFLKVFYNKKSDKLQCMHSIDFANAVGNNIKKCM